MPVFALVDVNNFYASCEALFDPKLRGIPLVVLSNNDGCVVARSAEAKVVGVPMGAPWHQLRDLARRHHIVAMSSNYALYADISNRVVEILRQFCPTMEVYSIDESFLDLAAFERHGSLEEYGGRIRRSMRFHRDARSETGWPHGWNRCRRNLGHWSAVGSKAARDRHRD